MVAKPLGPMFARSGAAAAAAFVCGCVAPPSSEQEAVSSAAASMESLVDMGCIIARSG